MSDLDMLKDIPGYKAILKSVLKSQIQLLIEQLADNTGEESIILTASVNDGTLSHLGSFTGKGFLEGRDEIKSQFLGYCLKSHHKKKSQDTRPSPYQRPTSQSGSPGNSPGLSRMVPKPGPKRPRVHPVSLQRAMDDTSSLPPVNSTGPLMSPITSGANTDVKLESGDGALTSVNSPAFTSTPSSFPSSLQLSHTQTSASGSDHGHSVDSGGVSQSADESNDSSVTNIKIEPITENEMELEITGVEPGSTSIPQEGWDQGPADYSGLPSMSGDDTLNQSGDQSGYNVRYWQDTYKPAPMYGQESRPGNIATIHINHGAYLRAKSSNKFEQERKEKKVQEMKAFAMKFRCQFCDRTFPFQSYLDRHLVKHTGIKAYKCDICERQFTRQNVLNNHKKSVHFGAGVKSTDDYAKLC